MGLQFGVYVLLLARSSTRVRWHPVSGSVCSCGFYDQVTLTSSCLALGEAEVLRDPGLCCCSASSRFQGWLWGLPNQCRFSVGVTPCLFSLLLAYRFYLFIRFLFILFMILLCPCILGSPGGLCITDTRRDE